jgi:hypothetical protein
MTNPLLQDLAAVMQREREQDPQARYMAIEFLRTHHAAIEQVVRDAESYRRIWAELDAEQVVRASKKFGDSLGVLKDAERYRYLRTHRHDYIQRNTGAEISLRLPAGADLLKDAAIDAVLDAAIEKGRK